MDIPEDAIHLSPEEARVLGCLLEKAATTPDAYPLSFNGLQSACNQKTNRNPVVEYDEDTLAEAIEGLREKRLGVRVDGAGSRVSKYRHDLDERIGLGSPGKALLAVLLLRGPQTPGELRQRTERMHAFPTTDSVEEELDALAAEIDPPLWRKLPPAPGQKEARYCQLLCGEPVVAESPGAGTRPEPALAAAQARNERIAGLEEKVRELEEELAALKATFETFRSQFD